MVITEVTLNQYRSWARLVLEPHPRLNVIAGPNAQGKSNLLEALYALVTTRPYRAQKDVEVIRFEEDFAHVHACLSGGGRQVSCEILWRREDTGRDSTRVRKEVRINRQSVHRLVDIFGMARMVLFSPRDLDLVTGAPELRRRYLDILLCQLSPTHLYALNQYQRVVQERNRYLKACAQGGPVDHALEEAWTDQLVRWGSDLMDRRRLSLERLAPILEKVYRHLGGQEEEVRMRYLPSTPAEPGETSAEAFKRHLHRRAREERARGLTACGPHRDDLEIVLNGHSMRLYGSQGQLRSMALAMRLAEGEMLAREGGEAPVLLLDDCLSEMDERRQDALWGYLAGRDQVFLTTCQWSDGHGLPLEGRCYRAGEGLLLPEEEVP